MPRLLILLGFLLPLGALAQDEGSESQTAPTVEEAPAGEEPSAVEDVSDEEIEELLGLDEDDYREIEEDDFEASVEVRYEQSVPFPTDI